VAFAFGLLAVGCGGSANAGDDRAPFLFYTQEQGDSSPPPSLDPNTPLLDPGAASALCGGGFQACGGVLAGVWSVEGVCASAPPDPAALQRWGQSVLGLNAAACADAVQAIDSRWGGQLRFEEGIAIDLRRRSDTAEMSLTRECLSKTFDIRIRADQLGAVCSSITSDSISCSPADDACQCTVQHERVVAPAGVYGVADTIVSIAAADGGHDIFDYCVEANLLQWREPETGQLLLLRRQSAAH
jgi:hypothetical protein